MADFERINSDHQYLDLDIGRWVSAELGPGLADLIKLREVCYALFDCYLNQVALTTTY